MGYCVYNADKGYLVTTNMKNKKGSPNPILIEKKCGNLSMADILTQVLYLSQLHVGSTQKCGFLLRLDMRTKFVRIENLFRKERWTIGYSFCEK